MKGKLIKAFFIVCLIIPILCSGALCFAAGNMQDIDAAAAAVDSNIIAPARDGLLAFFHMFQKLALAVGGVVISVSGIKMLTGNQKEAETAKTTIITVGIGLLIVYVGPLIAESVKNVVGG